MVALLGRSGTDLRVGRLTRGKGTTEEVEVRPECRSQTPPRGVRRHVWESVEGADCNKGGEGRTQDWCDQRDDKDLFPFP